MAKHRGRREALIFVEKALSYSGNECLIWPFKYSPISGYAQINIDKQFWLVHRYVCTKINGNPPSPKHDARHVCRNKLCIAPRHLIWGTRSENCMDATWHGTHRSMKLTLEQVEQIRTMIRDGVPLLRIAQLFPVTRQSIQKIKKGLSYGWTK